MNGQANKEFGRKIRECRRHLGWSQIEAAKRMNVQRTSLNRWENGHEMPRGENMTKLHDHLNVPIGMGIAEETTMYQLLLPFDKPIGVELRMAPAAKRLYSFEYILESRQANV